MAGARKPDVSNEFLLQQLDSLVADNSKIIQAKETKINSLRDIFVKSQTPAEKFNIARQLYGEYQVYDSDSALYYAKLSGALLNEAGINDYNVASQVKIDQAFSESVQGRFADARTNLNSIDPAWLDDYTRSLYFQAREYLSSLESIFFDDYNEDKRAALNRSNDFMDSISSETTGNRMLPWVRTALNVRLADMGEKHLSMSDSAFLALKAIVDSPEEPGRIAATNAYWLACFYRVHGDKENRIRYLTIAAIYDALIANREISALQELASILLEEEDIDRAFNYISFALDEVSQYKNSSKIGSVSKVVNIVRNVYEEDIRQRDKTLHRLVVALVIVAGVLLLSFFILMFSYRKLNSFRKKLSELNSSLKQAVISRDEAISDLKYTNDQLTESHTRNMGLLAFIIKLTTDYLGSFENFRKTLLVKFKGKQTADIETLLNNPDLVKNQYQTFYKNLDRTILAVFPDFMKEYNASSPEDQQMTEEDLKSGTLSTRMRIFGLKKLGIEKSGEIAQMLNISIRTVYNNR